ncbi:MFS transporter [Actinomadura barringtoniae]|uniref:MFS transporter n=1 Tax=Actinomadura barringtoniae TaxID=1427535 RepID=A0A939PBU5_9ACTN|nr:MFS transporter [Actinomadura barringtoniae]MBO2445606.1 MFS transporter [Actinomadura barringtoniae]
MAVQSQVRSRIVLAVLCLASFMAGLDLFIVNVAFDDIGRDFPGASLSDLSWVLNGYTIVFAALLVPLGRLSDRYGRKTGFLLGIEVFVLASQACAIAPSMWSLVTFRVLQAFGAAALIPTSLALLLAVFPPERRAGAVRIWSASAALAAAAGPAFGGVLVEASWRWVFEVNVPIGIVAGLLALRYVPDSNEGASTRIPDLPGTVLLTTAVALLSLGLVKINDWSRDRVLVMIGVSVLVLAVFWLRSLRHSSPVIEPGLLAVRTFAWSNATILLFSVAFAGNLLIGVLWMQEVWGYSAIRTGLGVAPGPLMVPVFAVIAGILVAKRIPVGVVTGVGCLLVALGISMMVTNLGSSPQYVSELLPGWLVGGVGVGLALPTILSTAAADLPPQNYATGSAVVNMSRQIGSVLGVALAVAVLGTPRGYADAHEAFINAWLVVGAFMIVAAVAALGMTPARIKPQPVLQPSARLPQASLALPVPEAATAAIRLQEPRRVIQLVDPSPGHRLDTDLRGEPRTRAHRRPSVPTRPQG